MDNLHDNVELCPKTKKQLENYLERILQERKESTKYNLLDLKKAFNWLKKIDIEFPELVNSEYYKLECSLDFYKELTFSVQIWDKYNEEVDILKRIFISSSDNCIDNDDDTIIISCL